jgi:hypothetical protein
MIQKDRVAIAATRNKPYILFEPGRICIRGRSISENPGEFFRPLLEWIILYVKAPALRTDIDMGFEYINTSSIKWIYAILKEMAGIKNSYANVKVTWTYERDDDDMFELGLILRSIIDCPFFFNRVDNIFDQS